MVQQLVGTSVASDDQPAVERRIPMTFEEYQAWWGEGQRGEWVDGEVIVFVAPLVVHQRIAGFVYRLLADFVDDRDFGEVFQSPVDMRLRDGGSYREPDVLFVAAENAGHVERRWVDGPADLAIEVVSDDSARRDRKDKFDEYAGAGVREYWVIDPRPLRQRFAAYTLTEEGYYDRIEADERGVVTSTVIRGFWLDPAWLWMDPLPKPRSILELIEATGEPAPPPTPAILSVKE